MHQSVDIICMCTSQVTGGAQNVAHQLTKSFQDRGYSAALCFLFDEEPDAYVDVNSFVLAGSKPTSAADWFRFVKVCRKTFGSLRPKVAFGFHPLSNIACSLFFGFRERAVSTQAWPLEQQSRSTAFIESLLMRTPLTSANIAVSSSVASTFVSWGNTYKRKTSVIYNNPTELPTARESVMECRRKLGIGKGKRILGCIGRLHEQKNFELAIAGLARSECAHLYIAGEGPEHASLYAFAKFLNVAERTHFLGPLRGADVSRFYKAVDVLLMPSRYEGHPLVMLEAMTQSTPIIAHDIPVLREAGGDAVVYCGSDPEEWGAAIDAMDSETAHNLSCFGLARVAKFTEVSMVDRYLEIAGLPPFKAFK